MICRKDYQVNPFAKRICEVFSPSPGQLMTFEEFLDMLSSLRFKPLFHLMLLHFFSLLHQWPLPYLLSHLLPWLSTISDDTTMKLKRKKYIWNKKLFIYRWSQRILSNLFVGQFIFKFVCWPVLQLLQLFGQSGPSRYLTRMATNFLGRTTSGRQHHQHQHATGRHHHQHQLASHHRRVVDAITGSDEAAYKSLGEKERQTVVRNVLKWGKDGLDDVIGEKRVKFSKNIFIRFLPGRRTSIELVKFP